MAQSGRAWPPGAGDDSTALLHQILAGLQSLQHQNARLSASVDSIHRRVDAIDSRIAAVEVRVGAVTASLERIEDGPANAPAPAQSTAAAAANPHLHLHQDQDLHPRPHPDTHPRTASHGLVDHASGVPPPANPTPQSSPSSPPQAQHGDLAPPPEAAYASFDAMERAMHAHTRANGFDLVRTSASKNKQGVIYKRTYSCSQHGRPPSRVSDADRVRKTRVSRARGCGMRVMARSLDIDAVDGPWEIRHRVSTHSHEPLPPLMHPGHRRRALTDDVRDAIRLASSTGQPPREILENLQLAKGSEALYTRTDLYNELQRQRLENEKVQNEEVQNVSGEARNLDEASIDGD
ncbi:hypothetical protein MBLNU459_g0412t1 [Dothideomycetes sp. NU459]